MSLPKTIEITVVSILILMKGYATLLLMMEGYARNLFLWYSRLFALYIIKSSMCNSENIDHFGKVQRYN